MALKKTKIKSLNEAKKNLRFSFEYQGAKYDLDLSKELSIDENLLNTHLIDSPSNYAFLCLVRNHYLNLKEKLEREKETVYASIWYYYKDLYPKWVNEMVTQKTIANTKYQNISEKLEEINFTYNTISSICKAFESREKILQTLSANLRKQS